MVLLADRTLQQRAHETQTHPAAVRKLTRRFRQRGMLGLLPDTVKVVIRGQAARIPDPVRQELDRLKALYDGFHYRELARILFVKLGYPVDDKTVKKLWQASSVACQGHLGCVCLARAAGSLPRPVAGHPALLSGLGQAQHQPFLAVARPTVDVWIHRFEAEHFAGLVDKSRAPKAPARRIWLPLMVQVYHLQKAHPDAREFRIRSLLARSDVSARTIGRVMALNKLLYDDIPHVPKRGVRQAPGPHPYKAMFRHQHWFIDGRRMDFALDGVRWWSRIILEGYSRTILAGAMAPSEATWVALMVLYTACLRYGVPDTLISDSGGAYTSNDFEAVCTRLQIRHEPIESTKGESYKNSVETHFNNQRRLYDHQFSPGPPLLTSPVPTDDEPVWLCHVAQLSFLCGGRLTLHAGAPVGVRRAVTSDA